MMDRATPRDYNGQEYSGPPSPSPEIKGLGNKKNIYI
jgi:hypothetical protein